jgi:hypothetical protein
MQEIIGNGVGHRNVRYGLRHGQIRRKCGAWKTCHSRNYDVKRPEGWDTNPTYFFIYHGVAPKVIQR